MRPDESRRLSQDAWPPLVLPVGRPMRWFRPARPGTRGGGGEIGVLIGCMGRELRISLANARLMGPVGDLLLKGRTGECVKKSCMERGRESG